MPLQKLQLTPGVNRESTSLANEGTWFEMDKVRFRSGFPEKLGGWTRDQGTQLVGLLPPAGSSYWGVARSLWNWVTLAGNNLLGVGTNLKYYIQNSAGGAFSDITPIRDTVAIASNAFTTINGSTTVTVNDVAHGAETGDFVTISGVSGAVNGIPDTALNQEFRVTVLTVNTYSIVVSSAATSSGTTGAATFAYQIPIGPEIYSVRSGWGAGGWGGVTGGLPATGWGVSASSGIASQIRLWTQDNYGQDLVLNFRGGGLYLWKVNANPTIYDRAVLLSSTSPAPYTTDTSCPTIANAVAVSDASRFVIAFGCNDYGETALDPLLIRWSDQENYAVWAPSPTTQAGSYRLSIGSSIVAYQQTRQEILVWTEAAIYSMQYLGPPYVWGFQILGDNISIVGPNASTTASNITFWMGVDKFYMYSGRVETLYCPLRQYIFGNINLEQQYQFFAGTNEGYNEIWWFYCSADSTVVNRYVIYNYLEKAWSYGNLDRTAWLDTALRAHPTAGGYGGQVVYHEDGVDDGSTNPPSAIVSYVQSADLNIGDGHNYGLVWRMIPDVTFDGSTVNNPAVTMTLRPRQNPGSNYGASSSPEVVSTQNYAGQRNYTVQQFTQIVYVRVRGRQMAFKIGSEDLGVQWQLGVPALDIRPDGRR